MTLAGDVFKGFIPVILAKALWHDPFWSSAIAIASVIGHNYPIFLKFKGGKGVATSFGVIFAINPYIGLLLLIVWLAVVFIWRYSSLGAIVSFAFFPFITLLFNKEMPYIILSVLLPLMILIRHKDNIRRLLDKKETKMWGIIVSLTACQLASLILYTSTLAYGLTPGNPGSGTLSQPEEVNEEVKDRVGDNFGSDPLGKLIKEWFNLKEHLKVDNETEISKSIIKLRELAITQGIKDLDIFSAVLVKDGYHSLAIGNFKEAREIAESARILSPNFPPAHYLLARISWAEDKTNIFMIMDNYLRGFWSMTANIKITQGKIRNTMAAFFIILSLSFIFFLFSTLFFRYSLLLEHNLGLHKIPAFFVGINRLLLWLILFLPILITPSLGWLILFWILIMWLYLSLKERMIIIAFLTFFSLSVLLLPYVANIFLSEDTDLINVFLRYNQGNFEKRNRSKDILVLLRNLIKENPEVKEPYILSALVHKKRKEYETSKSIYQNLLKNNHEDAEVYNNLGNIYYFLNDPDQAIKNYKEAIRIKADFVPAYYNLSQIYRERFMFDEGEVYFKKAETLNPILISQYTELSQLDPTYVVIDVEPSTIEIWPYVFTKTSQSTRFSENLWNLIFKEIAINDFHILLLSVTALLLILSLLKRRLPVALLCQNCSRIFCPQCDKTILFTGKCSLCVEEYKINKWDPKKRVERLVEGRDYKSSQKLFGRVITFILPGTGHIYYGYPIKGLLCLIISFFILFLIINWNGLYGGNPLLNLYRRGFAYYPFIIFSILVYLLMVRDLFLSKPFVKK